MDEVWNQVRLNRRRESAELQPQPPICCPINGRWPSLPASVSLWADVGCLLLDPMVILELIQLACCLAIQEHRRICMQL